jgi:light-regulated signal transduction histidine kinase (bacteriophytochrome)
LGPLTILVEAEMANANTSVLLTGVYVGLDVVLIVLSLLLAFVQDFQVPLSWWLLLSKVAALFAPKARAQGLGLRIQPPLPAPDLLRGDPLRLIQVLTNLVGNAIKFTDMGEVEVETQVVARSDQEVRLRFSIHDTGGMRLRGLRCLVVDDSDTHCELIAQALAQEDALLTTVADGQQAVQLLEARPGGWI